LTITLGCLGSLFIFLAYHWVSKCIGRRGHDRGLGRREREGFEGRRRRQNSGARGGAGVARPLDSEFERLAWRREWRRQRRERDSETTVRQLEMLGLI
jgi:hypothetical protein